MEPVVLLLIILRDLAFPILGIIGGVVLITRTRLGQALMQRAFRGEEDDDVHQLRTELELMRLDLDETRERLDFAERFLARSDYKNLLSSEPTPPEVTPV